MTETTRNHGSPVALSRRRLLRAGAAAGTAGAVAGVAAACGQAGTGSGQAATGTGQTPEPAAFRMPAEGEPHQRTVLAWPASERTWADLLPGVRADIAGVARAVAAHEPVTMLARPEQRAQAAEACGGGVEVLPMPVDDLWTRDTAPTYVIRAGQLVGVDLNFNGWGNKAPHPADGPLAGRLLEHQGLPRHRAALVAEGGALETDGAGTLLVTESSVVNDNRNPGASREQLERELKRLLGVNRVIWLAGVKGLDITDAHVDGLARFTDPGTVLLTAPVDPAARPMCEQARAVLTGANLRIVELPAPDPDTLGTPRGADFFGSYINYYVCNGAVIAPEFGDPPADDRAKGVLRELYPGRAVLGCPINSLAEGGGGIHCATQQIPRTP